MIPHHRYVHKWFFESFCGGTSIKKVKPVKMSDKHLTIGSTPPPFNGKLRVYSMRFCPYAQRTILALNAKNVPYEVVNINLTEKPEWYLTKSPHGKVPALEIKDGLTIYESLITAEYIDDKYPENPLTSKDPLRKAQDKLIIENFNKPITVYYKALFSNIIEVEQFIDGMKEVESELSKRKTTYLAGDKPGMVDYMIWPWFERFGMLTKFSEAFAITEEKFPELCSWIEVLKQDPIVKTHYLDLETHTKFLENRLNGIHDYDFLL